MYVRINRSELVNAPYNPRKISPAAKIDLRKSIENHGLLGSPIWNRTTGSIVGGHQRLEQLDTLEGSQNYSLYVSEIKVDLRQEKAINIALNNLNLQGEMDGAAIVEMIRNKELDLELTGYKPIDIEYMAYDAGLATDLIEGMFSPEAIKQIDAVAAEVDDVLDQADELKRRKAEARRRAGSSQPQDEDEANDDGSREDSEGTGIREQETAGPGGVVRDAEYFRNAKQPSESAMAQREVGYYLTLVFGSNEQKFAFTQFVGVAEQQAQCDGPMIAELCGCKLPDLKGKRKASAEEGVETADRGNV